MTSLSSLKKDQLITLAKQENILISSKMTKAQIITLLENTKTPIPTLAKSKNVKDSKDSIHKTKANLNESKKLVKDSFFDPKTIIPIPTKNISIQFNDTITVLPQADNRVLIIWNADPQDDSCIKAWQITNKLGLDILLPAYARSLFIDVSLLEKLDFSLYYIHLNSSKTLFKSYREDHPLTYPKLSHSDTQKLEGTALTKVKIHPSSANNFTNQKNKNINSSSNHFFRK